MKRKIGSNNNWRKLCEVGGGSIVKNWKELFETAASAAEAAAAVVRSAVAAGSVATAVSKSGGSLIGVGNELNCLLKLSKKIL